mgnify:CR=1 FL=1
MRCAAGGVNFNSGTDLAVCLEALRAQRRPVRVVVVDCASSDASRAVAACPQAGVTSRLLESNAGFSGGCNVGLEALGDDADVVGFFNPDCFPEPEFFDRCCAALERSDRNGGVAGRLMRPGGALLDSCGQSLTPLLLRVRDRGYGQPEKGAFCEPEKVLAACGAAMVFRRVALCDVAVDGRTFPDEFFAFWEDLDVGWRLRNAGWDIVYEPTARAVHRRGGTAAPGTGRLIFRRPPPLAACILLNRWATLLRNCHSLDLVPRLPLLLLADLALTAAVACRRPQVLAFLRRGIWRARLAARQRRHLQQRRLEGRQ